MSLTSEQLIWCLAAIVVAYLCGSIPFGLLVSRLKGIDIRRHGSGNIGATNVGRVLGRWWGIFVFFLDGAKSFLPVLAFGLLAGRWIPPGHPGRAAINLVWAGVGAACVLGHMFPIYLGFQGGKGVASSLGVLLGMYPYFTFPGLVAFALWGVLTFTTRYVSIGSVGAVGAFPVIFAIFARIHRANWGTTGELWPLYVFSIATASLVIYRHRGNMRRLYQGVESKIGTSTNVQH